jgi:hypothetical protein
MDSRDPKGLSIGEYDSITVNGRSAILKRLDRSTWTLTGQGFDAGHCRFGNAAQIAEDVNIFAETGEIPRSTQGRNW